MSKNEFQLQKYRSCFYIEHFHLNFNGINGHHLDKKNKSCMEFCCLSLSPGVTICDNAEESINAIVKLRENIIMESKRLGINKNTDDERFYTSTCAKCPFYNKVYSDFEGDGLIHFININIYPAPCQSKCIYCNVHNSESGIFNEYLQSKPYDDALNAIVWARKHNMISRDAVWQMASGEVSIHPYKDRILNIMKDENARFLTNCFNFDAKIAAILSANPRAVINVSIDAGTSETWYKIKGNDNFESVIVNLVKYSAQCISPDQITLKYIILPGINDNIDNYNGIINVMKQLNINKLIISRDNRVRYEKMIISYNIRSKSNIDGNRYNRTDEAICELTTKLQENNMTAENGSFWPEIEVNN